MKDQPVFPTQEERAAILIARAHSDDWLDKSDAYWLYRLYQEMEELAGTLINEHNDTPEHELLQIASICLNWIRNRKNPDAVYLALEHLTTFHHAHPNASSYKLAEETADEIGEKLAQEEIINQRIDSVTHNQRIDNDSMKTETEAAPVTGPRFTPPFSSDSPDINTPTITLPWNTFLALISEKIRTFVFSNRDHLLFKNLQSVFHYSIMDNTSDPTHIIQVIYPHATVKFESFNPVYPSKVESVTIPYFEIKDDLVLLSRIKEIKGKE